MREKRKREGEGGRERVRRDGKNRLGKNGWNDRKRGESCWSKCNIRTFLMLLNRTVGGLKWSEREGERGRKQVNTIHFCVQFVIQTSNREKERKRKQNKPLTSWNEKWHFTFTSLTIIISIHTQQSHTSLTHSFHSSRILFSLSVFFSLPFFLSLALHLTTSLLLGRKIRSEGNSFLFRSRVIPDTQTQTGGRKKRRKKEGINLSSSNSCRKERHDTFFILFSLFLSDAFHSQCPLSSHPSPISIPRLSSFPLFHLCIPSNSSFELSSTEEEQKKDERFWQERKRERGDFKRDGFLWFKIRLHLFPPSFSTSLIHSFLSERNSPSQKWMMMKRSRKPKDAVKGGIG